MLRLCTNIFVIIGKKKYHALSIVPTGVFAKYDPKMDDNGKWAVRVENHDDENHAKTAISDDEIKATALGSKT